MAPKQKPYLHIICGMILSFQTAVHAQNAEGEKDVVSWDQVRPVFQKRCFACHRGEQARGGLDLSSVAAIRAGSTSGAAVVSGHPEQSLIYTLPAHLENPQMPPSGNRISQRELELISGWISGGLSEKLSSPMTGKGDGSEPTKVQTDLTRMTRRPVSASDLARVRTSPLNLSIKPRSLSSGSPQVLPELRSDVPPVTAMATSPTATIVAVSGHQQVLLFNWETAEPVSSIAFDHGDIFNLSFSADGTILMVAGGVGAASHTLAIYQVDTGEQLFEHTGATDVILAADLTSDGRLAVYGGPERVVYLRDTVSGETIAEIRRHTDWVTSAAFSPDGLLAATGDRFGAVYVWETSTGKEFQLFRGHVGAVQGLHWSDNGDTLITTGLDGTMCTWDMHDGKLLTKESVASKGILCSDLVAGTNHIMLGSRSHQLERRSLQGETIWTTEMSDEVVRLAVSHDQQYVVAADCLSNVSIFRLTDGHRTTTIQLPVLSKK